MPPRPAPSRVRSTHLALALAVALAPALANAQSDPPDDVAHPQPLPPTARIAFNLQDAPVSDVARAVQRVSGRAVFVAFDAIPLIECVRVTILSRDRVAVARIPQLVAHSLRGSGLRGSIVQGTLRIERDPAVAPPASCSAPGPSPVPPSPPAPSRIPDVLRSIREVSPTEHAITRQGLDLFLENQAEIMRTTRIVPVDDVYGRTVGIRLFGVAPDSVLFALGFRNNDSLETVNGISIVTPERALEAYTTLRNATDITVHIQRGGAPLDLRIHIE